MSQVAVRRGSIVDDLRSALFAGGDKALIEHRMAPGGVAADQNDEIGSFDIVVAAGHDVLAEGADMAGDRRRHAQPRIGVDIGAADEALHQLVGDVVILGQELAGDVERHRVGPMIGHGLGEAGRDAIERLVPACIAAADLRIQQSSIGSERVAERRALRAEPAVIGGMVRVAGDRAVGRDAQPAADAAIGARGADQAALPLQPRISCAGVCIGLCRNLALWRRRRRPCSAKPRPKTI